MRPLISCVRTVPLPYVRKFEEDRGDTFEDLKKRRV